MVVKKFVGKNLKEREENLIAQKEIEKINTGEKQRDLWFSMEKSFGQFKILL